MSSLRPEVEAILAEARARVAAMPPPTLAEHLDNLDALTACRCIPAYANRDPPDLPYETTRDGEGDWMNVAPDSTDRLTLTALAEGPGDATDGAAISEADRLTLAAAIAGNGGAVRVSGRTWVEWSPLAADWRMFCEGCQRAEHRATRSEAVNLSRCHATWHGGRP